MRLVERFRLDDTNRLVYEYTIEDPRSYERSWSVAVPMTRTDGPMFEFACHEGNYGLRNILVNARAADQGNQTVDDRDSDSR